MKRFLAIAIAVLLMASSLSVPAFSAETLGEEDLRAMRDDFNKGLCFEICEGFGPLYGVFYEGVTLLKILLYTDLLHSLTLQYGHYDPQSYNGESFAYAPLFWDEFPDDETDEPYEWWYCTEIEELLSPYYKEFYGDEPVVAWEAGELPALWYCVKKYDIPKEELYAARDKMYMDPTSIRDDLPITDQQAEKWLVPELDQEKWALQDFMIEALYLEDQDLMHQLLLYPWYLWTNVGALQIDNLYRARDPKNEKIEDLTAIEIYTTQEGYEEFYEYCKAFEPVYINEDRYYWCLEIVEGWADRIADPPKTGDGTAFYALTALIALLPLAVVSICAAKKRRRAI